MTIVFTDATILTGDVEGTVLTGRDVVVRDGAFAAIGADVSARGPGRLINASDLLIMPGLINGHTHSPETLAKGRDEGSTLETWLREIWPPLDALEPRQIHVAALLGAVEMLRTGTLSVVDHFRQTPITLESVEAVVQAYQVSGMRAIVAVMLRDVTPIRTLKLPPAADQIAIVEEAHRNRETPAGKVRIALGPSAPTRCTDGLLAAARDLGERRGLLFHAHVDETQEEADEARDLYGTSNVRHLADLGLLAPSTSLAHGVWLNDDDIGLLAEAGAAIVHNPISNMRLGCGIAPVAALRDRGVPIAIGTDGAASNDGQNVTEAMKAATLLQRVAGVAPDRWLTARDVLAFATSVPAQALGFGAGRIEQGAPADFIAVRCSGYMFAPCNDWHRQIVYGAGGLDVRYAAVDGELLLDDGRITTFDEAGILAEAREIGSTIFAARR